MWVLDQKHSGIVLVRRMPARAATLAGFLGALLSLVPLVIAPEPGPVRFLSFAALALTSGALVYLGWSRPKRVELVQKTGGLTWGDEPLPPPSYVLLGGDSTEEPPAYQALIGWDDGRTRLALERDEPAEVLGDAVELARRLGLELRPGWGLERRLPSVGFAAAWESGVADSPKIGAASTGPVDLPLWPLQRRAAAITFVAGLFVLVVTASLIRSPHRSAEPGALSLALPVLAAGLTVVIGAVLLGIRRRIELGESGIASTTVVFGFAWSGSAVLGPPAARAFGVAPDRGPVRHVLFATSSGPLSVAADPDTARELAAHLEKATTNQALPAELPLATSARYSSPDRPARLRS
jgi:hypothetical protein